MRFRTRALGVILAGGGGRRIGGDKAIVELQGRPLISYPLEAVREALGQVAILAKADTKLPDLSGVTVWIEPDPRAHPVVGIIEALALADGRPVLVCAVDLPFVTARLIRSSRGPILAGAGGGGVPRGVMQPLLGCYQHRALPLLRAEVQTRPVEEAIAAIDPVLFEVEDPEELFDVNSPDDLLQAAAMLDRRRLSAPY